MITAKFGGTAVIPQNLHCLKNLVRANCNCVVVSAVGKISPNDTKTTDLLIRHFRGDNSAWSKIEEKYRYLVSVNSVNIDIDRLLFDAKAQSKISLAHCMSLGEELSAKVVAKFLDATYIEAADCIVFNGKALAHKKSKANLKSRFAGVKLGVIGGFYGSCKQTGRQVFSRGGGDVTGSFCAVALDATLYENWTDVNGVCKADPKLVDCAKTVANLSYNEMYALAKGGAAVLHPDAVKIARKRALPIKVGNYLNPYAPSTLISNCPSKEKFLSVTEKTDKNGNVVATVLHGMSFAEVFSRLKSVLRSTEKQFSEMGASVVFVSPQVFDCRILPDKVEIVTSKSILPQLYSAFSKP